LIDKSKNNIGKVDSAEIAPLPEEYELADEINSPPPEFEQPYELSPLPDELEAKGSFTRDVGAKKKGGYKKLQKQMTMIGMIAGVIGLSLTGTLFAGLSGIIPGLPDDSGDSTAATRPSGDTLSPDETLSPDDTTGVPGTSDDTTGVSDDVLSALLPLAAECYDLLDKEVYTDLFMAVDAFTGDLGASSGSPMLYFNDYFVSRSISSSAESGTRMTLKYGSNSQKTGSSSKTPYWFYFCIPGDPDGVIKYDRVVYYDGVEAKILERGIGSDYSEDDSFYVDFYYRDPVENRDYSIGVPALCFTGTMTGDCFTGKGVRYGFDDTIDLSSNTGYLPDRFREEYQTLATYDLDAEGGLTISALESCATPENGTMYEVFSSASAYFGYYYDIDNSWIYVKKSLKDPDAGLISSYIHTIKDGKTSQLFVINDLVEMIGK